MGFKRYAKKAISGAAGGVMGMTGGMVGGNLLGEKGREQAAGDIAAGYAAGKEAISTAYPKAQEQLASGMEYAEKGAREDYGTARERLSGGMESARGRISEGQATSRGDIERGYGEAKGLYEKDPNIVTSRAEIYNRILGKGGYSPETLNAMKASAREEYGTVARDIGMGLGTTAGDAGAMGLAQENYARALEDIGAKRAGATRDIDIQNAMLQEQQQTEAMKSAYEDVALRAGLSTDEAKLLSEINTEASKNLASIDQAEAAGLSSLTQAEAQMVEGIREKLAVGTATLTTDEAQLLAQLAAGGGAAMAATRDTQGLMPILGGIAQGATAALAK